MSPIVKTTAEILYNIMAIASEIVVLDDFLERLLDEILIGS